VGGEDLAALGGRRAERQRRQRNGCGAGERGGVAGVLDRDAGQHGAGERPDREGGADGCETGGRMRGEHARAPDAVRGDDGGIKGTEQDRRDHDRHQVRGGNGEQHQ
jgi:hypothetical protein